MATEEIPEGYGQWTVIYTAGANTRELAITCGYFNPGSVNPIAAATNVRDSGEAGTGALFDSTSINIGYSVNRIYCLQKRGGVLESGTLIVGNDGGRVGDTLPVTCSIVVAKNSARAGRQFRGRFLLPPCYVSEDEVNSINVIDPTLQLDLQGMMASFHSNLISNFVPAVLLHSQPKDPLAPVPTPTPVTSFSVRSQVGSDRRRLKRISA